MNCVVPAFLVIGPDDRALREVRIQREPRQLHPVEIARIEQTIAQSIAEVGYTPERARQMVRAMVEDQLTLRSMHLLRQDAATGLYGLLEQDPEELQSGPGILHVLSSDGIYLAALTLTRWIDFAMQSSSIYALSEDSETGLVQLTASVLEIPERVFSLGRIPPARH